jgi:ankyrin repeat protein
VDQASLDGMTPLMRAAKNGNPAMIRLLLKHNATVGRMANDGADAELYAFSVKDPQTSMECLKALVEGGLILTLLTEKLIYNKKEYLAPAVPALNGAVELKNAIAARNNGRLKQLLDAGVKPDIGLRYGDNAALLYASTVNNVEGMELLIKAGADVNLISPLTKKTPLANAATHGKREACKLLIDHGADPYIQFEPKTVGGDAFAFAALSKEPGLEKYLRELVDEREWNLAHPPPPDVSTAQPMTVAKPLKLKLRR